MKVAEFRLLLSHLADAQEALGCTSAAHALAAFSQAWSGTQSASVATAIKKLGSADFAIPEERSGNVTCGALGLALEHAADAFEQGKAKASAKDLKSVSSLLLEFNEISVDAFSQAMKQALETKSARSARAGKPKAVDQAKVRRFSDRLVQAHINTKAFEAILAELQGKGIMSAAELAAVANEFLGVSTTYKSKGEAIERMRRRHFQDVLHETRGQTIDRVRV